MYGSYLVGQRITHESFTKLKSNGPGTIIEHNNDKIKIKYDNKENPVIMPYPDAIKFIKFDNINEQKLALERYEQKLNEEQRIKELKRLEREELERKKIEEEKLSIAIKNKQIIIAKKKKYFEEKRNRELYPTWLVYQGVNFERESKENCLFVTDTFDKSMPFWDTMEELRINDVLLHCKAQNICAISQVWRSAYSDEDNVYGKGIKVCSDYIVLDNPLDLRPLREEIIKYNQEYRSPFNKNGCGNQGYLFPLDFPLAKAFITEIAKTNPNLSNVKYIQDIIT